MIVSAIDAKLQSLIDYLNEHYPTKVDVAVEWRPLPNNEKRLVKYPAAAG